jgi:hypothetical protein
MGAVAAVALAAAIGSPEAVAADGLTALDVLHPPSSPEPF